MLILIGGGSCAGKTTFAAQLYVAFAARGVKSQALSTDLFYKELSSDETIRQHDFDSEEGIDETLLHEICVGYPLGISSLPVFDFKTPAT